MDTVEPRARVDRFYDGVRLVGRFWVWFLFKGVDVRRVEAVPRRGPVLLCINHPNNLIDSLLVGVALPRKVHYLATAALFRHPAMRRFLLACGAIAVYRRQDDPDKMNRNADTFSACFDVLRRGDVVGIYPEGTTHAESRVQRIKTGAARIALEYESQRQRGQGGEPLSLIPVGLTFDARKSFRGRVRVAFGEAIPVAAYGDAYREDAPKAVEALTAAIEWGMQAQILHVERGDRRDLVRAIEDLYRGDLVRQLEEERGLSPREIDPLRISRSIADAVAYFEAHDPDRLERLWQEVQGYRALLAEYHVRDRAVRARGERSARRRIRRSWEASLGLPFFAYGAAVNALPYLVPRWLARRTARKETDYATTRLLASVAAFPLFWGLETWAVWRLAGAGWAALFALTLPFSGLLAYRYLGGMARLGGDLRLGALSWSRRQAAARLLGARAAVIALLERAKTDYLAATRGSSF